MTIPDLVIAIGIFFFILMGFYEGIIKKIYGLVILVIAILIAAHTYSVFAVWLEASFSISHTLSVIISFAGIFLFIIIAGNALYRVGGKRNELFKIWDRLAGSAFGLLEGLLIISIILHLLLLADIPSEEVRTNSTIYPLIYGFAPFIFDLIIHFIPQVRDFFEIFIGNMNINTNQSV